MTKGTVRRHSGPRVPPGAPASKLHLQPAGSDATVVVMPRSSQVGGVDLPGLLVLVITLAVAFAPLLLGRRASPGPSDAESDDGHGGGPPPPRRPPNSPSGGIPLQDAQPARVRLRNHDRLSELLPKGGRRPSRAPANPPTRTSQIQRVGARRCGADPLSTEHGCRLDQRHRCAPAFTSRRRPERTSISATTVEPDQTRGSCR